MPKKRVEGSVAPESVLRFLRRDKSLAFANNWNKISRPAAPSLVTMPTARSETSDSQSSQNIADIISMKKWV